MAKKGAILIYPVIFGFILALTIFYLLMIKGMPKIETSYIGEVQMATLKSMHEAEFDLTYIDNSAKLAGQQAIYELAENGGFKEGKCGNYGFNLWNNKDKECFPDYRNNFTSLFNDKLNKFLVKYNLIDNYNFILKDKLQIIGFAINDLEKEFVLEKGKIKGIYIPIRIKVDPKSIKEKYEEIKKTDPDLIEFIKSEAGDLDPYIILGVITAESYWDDKALRCEEGYEKKWRMYVKDLNCNQYLCDTTIASPQGTFHKVSCSYGLMQTIYPTAYEMGFNGEVEKLYDKRTNIQYGIKYLKKQFNEFKNIKDMLAAYNAGPGNVEKAKKCGKEFEQYYTCLPIPSITGPYVKKILAYSEIFKDIDNNQELKTMDEYLSSITGYAVKETREKSYGTYSTNPSFKINLDYNLDEYQNAIDDAKDLIEKCKNFGSNELLECINKNKKFTQDCETEKEKIISDFIELYESCSESNDFNCYCEMNINYKEGYEFPIASDEENYYIENRKFKSRDIDFIENYKVDKNEFSLKNNNKEIKGNKLVVYKEKRIIQPLPETIQLFFGKKEDTKLELFDKKIENPRLCNLKSERKFKFCYETSKQVLTEQGMKNPIIRFALTFPDTIAPEALNIEALNYQNDKNKIILTWNKNEGAAMYKIYYSENDFKDKKINELKANSELVNAEEIQEIELNKCEFNPEGEPCKFDRYNNKLENNKLYFVKNGENKDKYVYVLNLDKEYYFLITAVDDSGNEIDKIEDKNYKKIKSKNLLPLMQIKDLKVKQENSDVKLMWEKPEKYKDGSYFKNEEFKGYTIRLIEKKKTVQYSRCICG